MAERNGQSLKGKAQELGKQVVDKAQDVNRQVRSRLDRVGFDEARAGQF